MWLCDALVRSVISYGVEIWGWKKREGAESLNKRYLKWVIEVKRRTLGYMLREEMQRDKLKGRAGMRAAGFERKLKEGKGSGLARKCWEEVNRRSIAGRNLLKWQEKRRECFRGMGMELDGREWEGVKRDSHEGKRDRKEGEVGEDRKFKV